MLEALRSRPELEALLPFRRRFYGAASRYVWTDDAGADSEVLQAEVGEQGDPLMPHFGTLCARTARWSLQVRPWSRFGRHVRRVPS